MPIKILSIKPNLYIEEHSLIRMMFPTHVLSGLIIGLFYTSYVSGDSFLLLTCVFAATLSDLDIFIGQHRKTLHYPVYAAFIFFATIPLLYINMDTIVYINSFMLCVSIHAWSDAIGGGLGKYPWKTEENLPTVYNHYAKTWLYKHDFPYRIEYDGSPLDLGIFLLFAGLIFSLTDSSSINIILFILFIIAFIYTITRRRLVQIEDKLDQYSVFSWFIQSLHGSNVEEDEDT